MKKINYFLCLIATSILLFGCSISNVSYFYQVYETRPISDNISISNNCISYEDKDCIVLYNFWQEYGTSGFTFNNKTDSMIYLDLSETFFIDNGIAYDYYQNRVYSNSSNTYVKNSDAVISSLLLNNVSVGVSSSSTATTTNSHSVSNIEKSVICIPSKTMKIISGFNLQESLYNTCSINLYPNKKAIKEGKNVNLFVDKSLSPLTFSNLISYSFDKDIKDVKRIENAFYVSKISCLLEDDITYPEYMLNSPCDTTNTFRQLNTHKRTYLNSDVAKPNSFYITYDNKYANKENPFSF
jgi:hypothetical protein